jgi:NAD kinase
MRGIVSTPAGSVALGSIALPGSILLPDSTVLIVAYDLT